MTYDDWKTTDDTPEPEPEFWCDVCHHASDYCDCPCCNESEGGLGCSPDAPCESRKEF